MSSFPPMVTRDMLPHVPDDVKRIKLVTNGRFQGARGWRELPGGIYIGEGQSVLPLVRLESDEATELRELDAIEDYNELEAQEDDDG